MWCVNKLTVEGPEADLMEFVESAKGFDRQYPAAQAEKQSLVNLYQKHLIADELQLLCFHALVPVPPHILDQDYRVGYDWEMKQWGCKWGATGTTIKHCPIVYSMSKVIYKFKTPNNAPVAFLNTVSKMFSTLKFYLVFRTKFDVQQIRWNDV